MLILAIVAGAFLIGGGLIYASNKGWFDNDDQPYN